MVIPTHAGFVKGVKGPGLRTWRGIPYGRNTGGKYRFRAPRPVKKWDGIRDCSMFGDVASQPTYSWTDKIRGTEDCLNLDVVRPDTDEKLPVVVYLHGGSYIMGSSSEKALRGYNLVKNMNVVYVSVNFRLGALGYLDMRSVGEDCVANPALHDQLLALRWVQRNIEAFGGDPGNVTLMGESAGAAAVVTLMCVPAASGLFHRAIAQSAPIISVHSSTQAKFWARELIYRMALPRETTLDELRQESADDLVRAGQSMMWRSGELLQLNSCYGPTVDGTLLPDHPLTIFNEGRQHRIPFMIGTNDGETSFSKAFYLRSSARRRAALRMLSVYDPNNATGVVEAYGGAVSRSDFSELLADALFWAPSIRIAQAHAYHDEDTWMYRFDYAPESMRKLGLGAIHSFELNAVFGDHESSRSMNLAKFAGGMDDLESITELVQDHWRQFIYHGRPGSAWHPYRDRTDTAPGRATFIIDTNSRIAWDPRQGKRTAWENYNMLEWGTGRPDLVDELDFIEPADVADEAQLKWIGRLQMFGAR
ncbi:hypothetical protein CDES_05485 [Corynebacterium deserti GIMN1.010]|uniref:Carboxylic ester hydrolase n=2 Tax=Corynebacterium TaxID=1716 RepID=A0A0M4CHU8_9CORY|nr:hypothetical protein CDES_05485 [Corynebacterium deserti GIMN1.010]